jgi:hypothetical protein
LISLLAYSAVSAALLVSGVQQGGDPVTLVRDAFEIRGPSYEIAQVENKAKIEVHGAPDGPIVTKIGDETEFGSPRVLYVGKRSGDWIGAPLPELPNGELGWIRADPAQLEFRRTSYSLRADLSRREVDLRYGNVLVSRIPVTVGASGTETPPGTFSVTDGLAGADLGPWYGCCVLALSGRQPNLPAGWLGGNRIAIHGSPGVIGGAASHGCLRASDRDMVTLFALVPLGAPVFVRP